MHRTQLVDIDIYRFAVLEQCECLTHAVTAKPWNLAAHRGPQRELAAERRRRICDSLGVRFDHLTVGQQVHEANVARVDFRCAGQGRFDRDGAVVGADALFTTERRLPLMALSADCPLLLVVDPQVPVISLAHASWKGTFGGLTTKLVKAMAEQAGGDPARMLAAISPSAGPCCYQIKQGLIDEAARDWPDCARHLQHRNDKHYLNLWSANTEQLVAAGMGEGNVEVAGICTICDERFFSYRREGKETGRFALIAALQ